MVQSQSEIKTMEEDGWFQWWDKYWFPSSSKNTSSMEVCVMNSKPPSQRSRKPVVTRRRREKSRDRETIRRHVVEGEDCDDTECIADPSINRHIWKPIFELYDPWKQINFKDEIQSLPEPHKSLFESSCSGNFEDLERLLLPDVSLVNTTDLEGRTLLHFACAFGHLEAVELLLLKGADPSAVDSTNCITPLVAAAVIGDELIMNTLLARNIDINQGLDIISGDSSTALCWAVRAENTSAVKYLLTREARLTGTFIHRETPLHQAASSGNSEILKLLLQYGSSHVELKGGFQNGNLHSTALHVAVENGHESCIEALLTARASPNSRNAKGQTPLHVATLAGDFDAIRLLLIAKGNPDIQDHFGRTSLHYCALNFNGHHQEIAKCLELLLEYSRKVDIQDELGYTAFHLAVMYDLSHIVAILLRHGADLTVRIKSGQSGLEILVKKMPHAIRYVKDSLDLAMSLEDKDTADPKCTLILDFRAIVTSAERKVPAIPKFHRETEFLTSLCETGHKSILSHPLIEAFLVLKWQKVRKYFWASFLANLLMVATYSWFLFTVYNCKCPIQELQTRTTGNHSVQSCQDRHPDKMFGNWNTTLEITWMVLIVMAVIFTIKEVLQMIQSLKMYIKLLENYVQVFFVVTIVVTTFPVGKAIGNNDCICDYLTLWEYHFAAIGIPVAWFLVLLRIGRLPRLGLYVQMLFRVVLNFGLFMTAYASILIAFALSFCILIKNKPEFDDVFISLQTVLVMMTGEVNIQHVLPPDTSKTNLKTEQLDRSLEMDKGDQQLTLWLTQIMFAAFVLLVTIVLMNLLVGLAVSDIQGLHNGAKVARLSRLVVAISQLESVLFSSKGPILILPSFLRKRLQRSALVLSSDNKYEFQFRPHDTRDTRLPQALQMEALGMVEKLTSEKILTRNQRNLEFVCEKDKLDPQVYKRIQAIEKCLESLNSKFDKIVEILALKSSQDIHKVSNDE